MNKEQMKAVKADMQGLKSSIKSHIGETGGGPNTMWMFEEEFMVLINHPEVIKRYNESNRGG